MSERMLGVAGVDVRRLPLGVQLLGGFALVYDGVPVPGLATLRLQSLLAYLLLHAAAPQPRRHVAFLLWPDTRESLALNNLRQALYQLRQALPDAERFLGTDSGTICWRRDDAQDVDVTAFEHTLAAASAAASSGDPGAARRLLEAATLLYQGDLVPGCYDDWIVPERERLRALCCGAYRELARLLEEAHQHEAALAAARELLRFDALDEDAYVLLMRLHSLNHDRHGVQRVYHSAVETLRRELAVEPDEGLRQAYERLQRAAATYAPSAARDAGSGHLPLVGRRAEWQQLQSAWQRAAGGHAHVVLITGEAGVGKSRLAEELYEHVRQAGLPAAHARSYAAEGRLSLAPVTEWLRGDALRPALAALERVWLSEVSRLLPELLAEHAQLARPEPIGEYGQRQRFFEALARAVLAAPSPLLLWVDDLQWCDAETFEWLHFLLRFKPDSPLLVLCTARPEETPPDHPLAALSRQLRVEDRLVSIDLPPLDAAETARLASQVGGRELGVAAAVRLYRETEGNALFVVESVRAGIGAAPDAAPKAPGSAPGAAEGAAAEAPALPPRVQAVIAGRLAQLTPSARRVAETGAAIGRAFTLDLVRQAAGEDEETLTRALDELWQKRILREQRANLFDFTHDKLREVAYAEISAPQRRLLHRRIAQAIEALYAGDPEPVSAQVAAQYEQAGMFEQAIPCYRRAGTVAAGVYANDDAIYLLTRALALLAQMPPGSRRDAQELALLLALAALYRITKGWASPEVQRGLDRALVLSDKVGDVAQRAQVLYGLQSLYVVAARLEKVQYTFDEMRRFFQQAREDLPPFAGLMYAGAQLHMGRLAEAREQFEDIVAVRNDKHIRDLQESQGVNYLTLGHAWNSHALWCLGYPQTALQSGSAAVQLAREYAQPFNQALTITYLAMLQDLRAGSPVFQAHAEEALVLTREYQAPYYHAWAAILAQFSRACRQPGAEALARLRDAIHAFTQTGAHLRMPYYLSLLARACYDAGRPDEALAAVEQALSESLQNNERWWDAELHRLRGELMRAQGAEAADVEAAFRRALEVARAQGARSLELRAATSLARLWQPERPAEARQLLAPVYAWFGEGFDTPDLQAAQALLADLPVSA